VQVGRGDQLGQALHDPLHLQSGLSDLPGPQSFDVCAQLCELDVLVAPAGPQLLQLVITAAICPCQRLSVGRIGRLSKYLFRGTVPQHSEQTH
jgi:hypothetical protein